MRQEFRILIDVVFNVQSQELYRTIDLFGEELQLPYDHVMFAEEQVCGEGATRSSDSDEQAGSIHLQSEGLKEHKLIMNGNHRIGYSERVTRVTAREFSRIDRSSHSSGRKRVDKDSQEAEHHGFNVIGMASERPGFNSVIQNASMSFSAFVETKFVPEHVQHKTLAGRTHYQAMLKHLISPEIVHRMFNAEGISKARLQSIPGWPYLDQVRLCDLTAEHVRSLVAAAFARNYAWQTVKHIKNVAFAIIAHAQQEGCFHRLNPGSHVKLPPRTHRAKPDLTMSQARAILQLLPSPEKHIAFLALSTGMNIQEICNLQWKHVNLANSPRVLEGEIIPPYCIAVRTHWNPAGLGNASTRRNRNIALSARLFAVLADWALEKRALNPEEFVLVSDTGQPILRANLRSSRLVTTGRKLGIPWLSWRVLCRAHFVNLSEFWASTRPHGWQRDVEWIDRVPAEETI